MYNNSQSVSKKLNIFEQTSDNKGALVQLIFANRQKTVVISRFELVGCVSITKRV